MAIATGPMLSMEARGGFGRALTFRQIRGRSTVGRWLAPPYRNTPAQSSIRRYSLWLQQQWASIEAVDKATWVAAADAKSISPYHEYLSQNMKRWQNLQPPTQIEGAPGTAPFSAPLPFAAYTASNHRAYLLIFFAGLDFETTTAFVRKDTNPPGRDDYSMQLTRVGASNEMNAFTISFEPGTYYFWAYTGSIDGKKGLINGPRGVVL